MYACTVPDLRVADQKMLLSLWHSFIKSLSGLCAQKLPGLFLCILQRFDMQQSAIWLFVLDFS
jgi:hypothetical protein